MTKRSVLVDKYSKIEWTSKTNCSYEKENKTYLIWWTLYNMWTL